MTDSMVERVARAICSANCGQGECGYPNCACLGMVEAEARAAIAAMETITAEMDIAGVTAAAERLNEWAELAKDAEGAGNMTAVAFIISANSILTSAIYRAMIRAAKEG